MSFMRHPFVQPPIRTARERDLFIDNLLVRIHFIIDMIWWTGLAPWEVYSEGGELVWLQVLSNRLQGYFAHKKQHHPLGAPDDPVCMLL